MTAEAHPLPPVPRRRRPLWIVFFVEMALSPVVAGIALLVPVVKHWGAYGYIPAIVWLALFIQCLITFRWRGLWFLIGPPVAFVAIEAFLVAAPAAPQLTPPALSPVQQ
jgi:ABC-type molybdate transport system permease subunit